MESFDDRSSKIRRRLVTVPRLFAVFAALTVFAPVLLVVAAGVDAIRWATSRKPWVTLRLVGFAWIFTGTETIGVLRLGAIWVLSGFGARRQMLLERSYKVQWWFAATTLAAVRALFAITIDIDNEQAATPGPVITFVRHVSIVDNLLPPFVFSVRNQMRMRWVLKRELLDDPALDIAALRLPNYFVDRSSARRDEEIEAIRALGTDLGTRDGVVIYPEGTRFTDRKRAAMLKRLERTDPATHRWAIELQHTLPPKIGGPLALLESGADVVFFAHRGLEGFAHIRDIWRGEMVGRRVQITLWRVPSAEIPDGVDERTEWLHQQWLRLDHWVAQGARPDST